jgi:NRPS condensation-like uncharacterized protein
LEEDAMAEKSAAKNQLTAPKPVATSHADEVRASLAKLKIEEQDVADAIAWARHSR